MSGKWDEAAEKGREREREEKNVCVDAISTKLHKNVDVAVLSPAFSHSPSSSLVFMRFITKLTLFTAACLDSHVSFLLSWCFFFSPFILCV